MKSFLFLLGAIVSEAFATSMLNASNQFTKLYPSVLSVAGYCASLYLLSLTLRTMPVGIAYAIWSSLGIVLITLIGVFAFKQAPDMPAIIGMILIIAGVVIINLFSKMKVH
ncbi:MAG: QacE family quaternary ammonium compound efflux SMR transporter [Prevotella sp.]|nr:QacE family quaternary ammonium compound efflux SMR transporter [Prevotella sp.]